MTENESVADASSCILIQINGEKTGSVKSSLSKTIEEFRAILRSQEVELPRNAQFLDAQGYPVSVINEKSFNISGLVSSTNDGKTIKLRTKECTTNVDTQRSTMTTVTRLILTIGILSFAYYISNKNNRTAFINKQVCPLIVNMNFTILVDKFNCSIDQNTTDYLKDQVTNVDSGIKVFDNTGTGIKEVELTSLNLDYVTIYNDWVENKTKYKDDYEWYNNMKSNYGHCPGHFDEKVMHSSYRIKDTPESIGQFIEDEFQDWPQKLKTKINIENRLEGTLNDDGGEFNLDTNGKISTNMYLVAWKREENDTVRIHTYITIFERTAGNGCHFNPDYWSGHTDRIKNAKKYLLLTKVESNPVLKTFLLGNRRT